MIKYHYHDCDDHRQDELLMYLNYKMKTSLMQVFLINEVGADSFLQRVEEFEEENCI